MRVTDSHAFDEVLKIDYFAVLKGRLMKAGEKYKGTMYNKDVLQNIKETIIETTKEFENDYGISLLDEWDVDVSFSSFGNMVNVNLIEAKHLLERKYQN